MKLSVLLLISFLISPFFLRAQQPQDLKYSNVIPATAKPLHMAPDGNAFDPATYGHNLCKETETVAFATHLRNTGNMALTNVIFRGILYDHLNNVLDSVESKLSTLLPGDTINYFYLPPLQLPAGGQNFFRIEFFCIADNITKYDFLQTNGPLSIDMEYDHRIALDFGQTHNSIGTPQLGDHSAMGIRFDLSSITDFDSLGIHYSNATVAGGTLTFLVYDTTGFHFVNGFSAGPIFSKTFPVGSKAQAGNYVKYDLSDSQGFPLSLSPGTYYGVIDLQSQVGQYPILIQNDQTMSNIGLASIMYATSPSRWFTSFSNNRHFNSPHIRLYAANNSQNSCTSISLKEQRSDPFYLTPNPVKDRLKVTFTELSAYPRPYTIFDLSGKVVQKGQLFSSADFIELSYIRPGMYIISFTGSGQALRFNKE